jgi:hypothetical protein
MADIATQAKTNGEFVKTLLATRASGAVDAKGLLSDFLGFKAWLNLPATSESLESIAEVFTARVFTSLKSLKGFETLYQEKLKNVHEFLRTIRQMASADFGAEINLAEANSIFDQLERM